MKLLFININMHPKNLHALLNYNIDVFSINHSNLDTIDLSIYDVIYSPSVPINVSKYPNSKFLFGPHFSVFPEKNHIDLLRNSRNVIYIQPSDWVREVWSNNYLCDKIKIETLPFGVDTDKFNELKPIEYRNRIFLYYKRRHPNELDFLVKFFEKNKIEIQIFSYTSKYNEEEYINCLQNSKFGIWLGTHESQGFALEEALSCNVPLLVWNAVSMNQEFGYHYDDISSTSIPYWSDICGESFLYENEFEPTFYKFVNNLKNYAPRDYVLKNLSMNVCNNKFITLINKIGDHNNED